MIDDDSRMIDKSNSMTSMADEPNPITYGEGSSGPITISGPVEITFKEGAGQTTVFQSWSRDSFITWVAGQAFANNDPRMQPNAATLAKECLDRAKVLADVVAQKYPGAFIDWDKWYKDKFKN